MDQTLINCNGPSWGTTVSAYATISKIGIGDGFGF